MPLIVTRDGLKSEDQLKDEETKRTLSELIQNCVCGKRLKFSSKPQQKITACPDCGFQWLW